MDYNPNKGRRPKLQSFFEKAKYLPRQCRKKEDIIL